MGCIHYRDGQCYSTEKGTCPFFGCDCSGTYEEGVAEAIAAGYEGFEKEKQGL